MTAHLTDEHRALRDAVRRFVDDHVVPTVMRREREAEYPADLLPLLGELGVLGMSVPAEHGGSEVDLVGYALVFEELARGWMGLASVVGSSTPAAWLVARYGTPEQKDRYLPALACGAATGAMAMTEPSAGSDLRSIRMTARLDGDHYRVDGTKTMITHARHAAPLVLLVRTDPAADPPHHGMSLLLVDRDTPGYTIGRDIGKLGHKGVELNELVLDGARVPAGRLLGGVEGRGFHQIMSALDRGRIYMAAASVGIARAALEAALAYTAQREQFGRVIADHQAVRLTLARMSTDVQAARLLTLDAAAQLDEAARPQAAPQRRGRASAACAMAKVFASEVAIRAATDAMRLHGGYGFTTEFPVERYYRDAPLMAIGEGMNDILLLTVADSLLGRR